jgi:hypothetical protein
MATIGYCHDCGAWVTLPDDLTCPNGHPAARVNGWYDAATGQPLASAAPAPAVPVPATPAASTAAPAPVPAGPAASTAAPATSAAPLPPSRSAFLTAMMATVATNPAYTAEWGSDTDMTMTSNPVDGAWGAGTKRVEYAAALKAVEADRTVYFWEMLKERSSGMTFGTFETESYTTVGMRRSGTKKEAVMGPGSASWEWGYGTLRALVEDVAARHGFTVRVVLTRHAASW